MRSSQTHSFLHPRRLAPHPLLEQRYELALPLPARDVQRGSAFFVGTIGIGAGIQQLYNATVPFDGGEQRRSAIVLVGEVGIGAR